jgi:hypothetical protein
MNPCTFHFWVSDESLHKACLRHFLGRGHGLGTSFADKMLIIGFLRPSGSYMGTQDGSSCR